MSKARYFISKAWVAPAGSSKYWASVVGEIAARYGQATVLPLLFAKAASQSIARQDVVLEGILEGVTCDNMDSNRTEQGKQARVFEILKDVKDTPLYKRLEEALNPSTELHKRLYANIGDRANNRRAVGPL